MTATGFADATAITGIGWTSFSRESGATALTLAAQAALAAIRDAGLIPQDIDGVLTFHHGRVPRDEIYPGQLVGALGMTDCRYEIFSKLGGGENCSIVATAAMAVYAGLCRNVLVFYSSNARSHRPTATQRFAWPPEISGVRQREYVYGAIHAGVTFGPKVVAHMNRFGTTNADLGLIAVNQRRNALLNRKAMMRKPMTIDDHQNSPWIIYPHRLLDCCLQSDGAVALVVSSTERARDLRQAPIAITAIGGSRDDATEPWQTGAERTAEQLYRSANITAGDLDLAELYDPFTGMCLLHIEGFGLAPPGEGIARMRSGDLSLDGPVPVNTHGGLLSEAHTHGVNAIIEAVQQLRPAGVVDDLCDGEHTFDRAACRQVRDAQIGLVCGESGSSALILRRVS